MTGRNIKLSVHMPAYNHAGYVAQAIESAANQAVDFDYEIVVADDCSTDDTLSELEACKRRYPDLMQLIAHPKNLGIYDNDQSIIRRCRGEYIAWLEADDYWLDPNKLQRQVELLDDNPDFSACFHRAICVGDGSPPNWRGGPDDAKPYYTLDDLLARGHFIPSCTAVFRGDIIRTPLEWTRGTPFLERTYAVRFALAGKIGFIDREWAAFRYHDKGVYARSSVEENLRSEIESQVLIGKHFGLAGSAAYHKGLAKMYRALAGHHESLAEPGKSGA
jgi:glycosyltransferase involved in cell wall biosynthesis